MVPALERQDLQDLPALVRLEGDEEDPAFFFGGLA